MPGGWYYAHKEQAKLGPFSGEKLKELAASGAILPMDTVWKAGVNEGVPAHLVKNLFVAPVSPPLLTTPETPKLIATGEEGTIPFEDDDDAKIKDEPKPRPKPMSRATATALKGATIVSQDGVDARYRMKCTKCGHADSSCRTIKIMAKTIKSGFFCPKCKKRCEVVIQGRVS